MSYSQFDYAELAAKWQNGQLQVSFKLANTGKVKGKGLGLVFAHPSANHWEAQKRLIGWAKAELKAGANKKLQVNVDPLSLAVYDTQSKTWQIDAGEYEILLAQHAMDPAPKSVKVQLNKMRLDIKGNLLP